ncbi:MAG: hypothetical protein ACLUSL_01445 [Ruminococcus sp.]
MTTVLLAKRDLEENRISVGETVDVFLYRIFVTVAGDKVLFAGEPVVAGKLRCYLIIAKNIWQTVKNLDGGYYHGKHL